MSALIFVRSRLPITCWMSTARPQEQACLPWSVSAVKRKQSAVSSAWYDECTYQDLLLVVAFKAVAVQQQLCSIAQHPCRISVGIALQSALQKGSEGHGDHRGNSRSSTSSPPIPISAAGMSAMSARCRAPGAISGGLSTACLCVRFSGLR